MREILFRGKRVENGEWVYGDYCGICRVECSDGDFAYRHLIHRSNDEPLYMVDPETVGEYTGLTDENGKKIFEGDIVKLFNEYVAVIIFESAMFLGKCEGYNFQFSQEDGPDIEVIGNTHDNPELLEVKE